MLIINIRNRFETLLANGTNSKASCSFIEMNKKPTEASSVSVESNNVLNKLLETNYVIVIILLGNKRLSRILE